MDQSLIQIARDDLPKFVDSLVVEMTAWFVFQRQFYDSNIFFIKVNDIATSI